MSLNLGVGVRRELRSWLVGALGAIPVAAVLAVGIYLLPTALQRPVLVVASLAFWLVIWIVDRVPVFAIATWLVPALALIGLAHLVGSPTVFYGTLVAVVVVIGLMSMYDWARRPWARYCSRIQRWLISRTLPQSDRRVHDALLRAMRLDRGVRLIARELDDLPATARAFRQPAERILATDAPDEEWRAVIRATAEPGLAYADMLEGKRPLDYDLVRELARRRDEALARLLNARSRAYGWLTYTLLAAALVVVMLAGCGTGSQSPSPGSSAAFRLPTAGLLGACDGIGLDGVLAGDPNDPRVAWLAVTGGGRRELVFPVGFTARFSPGLEILNASGEVVFRKGDRIDGGCLTVMPGMPVLVTPP